MPAESDANVIDGEGRGRSTTKGDVPERLRRRYFLDERGGPGLGYYVDARIQVPAFRDRGAQLVASRSDPNAVRDMTAIAQHRGWTVVVVRGEANFRREAWLAAMSVGLEVRGYRATPRDRQDLERRIAEVARRAERHAGAEDSPRSRLKEATSTLQVVETVVRARVSERPAQDRILEAARSRIGAWLERGARLDPLEIPKSAARQDRARERQRSR